MTKCPDTDARTDLAVLAAAAALIGAILALAGCAVALGDGPATSLENGRSLGTVCNETP